MSTLLGGAASNTSRRPQLHDNRICPITALFVTACALVEDEPPSTPRSVLTGSRLVISSAHHQRIAHASPKAAGQRAGPDLCVGPSVPQPRSLGVRVARGPCRRPSLLAHLDAPRTPPGECVDYPGRAAIAPGNTFDDPRFRRQVRPPAHDDGDYRGRRGTIRAHQARSASSGPLRAGAPKRPGHRHTR